MGYVALLAARGRVWNGEGIDECYYYAQATSPLFDGDLRLDNDLLLSRNGYDLRQALANRTLLNGKPDVPFPCGMAVLAAPGMIMARAVHNGSVHRDDRFSYSYRAVFTGTTWVLVLLGLIACQRIAARFTGERCAAALTGALFLGTNLCYYTWVAPAMPHGASFGIGALFLLSLLRYRERPGAACAAMAGVLAGMAFLLRWQDAIFFAGFVAVWFLAGRRGRHLALAVGFAVIAALPQFVVWMRIYGSPLVIPQGGSFFVAEWWRPLAVLFSPLNGWIATHPLVALFAAGFVVLRRDRIVAVCMALVLAEVLVNSLAGDWWAGGSFGGRRFVSVLAFLVPAAAIANARATRSGRIFAGAFIGCCVAANLLLVMRFTHEAPRPVFWGGFAGRLFDYLQFATHSRDAILSSDLFCAPYGVMGARRVGTIMLMLLVGTAVVGWCAVMSARGALRVNQRVPAALLALWFAGCAGGFAAMRGLDTDDYQVWTSKAAGAIRDDDRKALREVADAQRTTLPIVRVYQLESAITSSRWDDATTISATLVRDYPTLVGDSWRRYAAPHRTERDRWVAALDGEADPPVESLEHAYGEASSLRDAARVKALRARLQGPSWFRDMHRFREEYDSGQGSRQLRRRCVAALDTNPFYGYALQELLRLDRETEDFDSVVAHHHRAMREAIELAEYVHAHHAGSEAAFEHLWRGTFVQNFQYMEWRGVSRHAGEQFARAKELGMRARDLEYWEKRRETAARFERRLMTHDAAPPKDAPEAFPLEFPATAIACATPQWLRYDDGWGGIESNEETGESWRWSLYPTVFVPLDHSLPAGKYALRLRGRRLNLGEKQPNVKFDFYGELDQQRAALYDEVFDLTVPLAVPHRLAAPLVRMNHSTYPVSEHFAASKDKRRVGMIFYQLWVEPLADD